MSGELAAETGRDLANRLNEYDDLANRLDSDHDTNHPEHLARMRTIINTSPLVDWARTKTVGSDRWILADHSWIWWVDSNEPGERWVWDCFDANELARLIAAEYNTNPELFDEPPTLRRLPDGVAHDMYRHVTRGETVGVVLRSNGKLDIETQQEQRTGALQDGIGVGRISSRHALARLQNWLYNPDQVRGEIAAGRFQFAKAI